MSKGPENINMGQEDPTSAGYDQPPPSYDHTNAGYNQPPPAGYSQPPQAGYYQPQPVQYGQPQPAQYGQPQPAQYPMQTNYIQPVATNNTTVVVQNTVMAPPSYMCLACMVYWFCNWLLGGIAMILALTSQNAAESGDVAQARSLGRASMWVSIAGIIVTVVLGIIIVILFTTGAFTYDVTTNCINGYDCY